jgi:hypothetical protein
MSSIGAAPAMDIDMSLLPPSGTQETTPTATGDDDDVTVAGSNLSPPLPQWTLIPIPWFWNWNSDPKPKKLQPFMLARPRQ